MRRAARADANQTVIVETLRQCGAKVQPLHMVGHGFPDLIVCYRGILALGEIKDGDKSPSRQRLTPDEAKWHQEWQEAPLYILRSVDDVLAMLGQMQELAPRTVHKKGAGGINNLTL